MRVRRVALKLKQRRKKESPIFERYRVGNDNGVTAEMEVEEEREEKIRF